MYDRGKELIWKNVRDIGFVAAMGKVCGIIWYIVVVFVVDVVVPALLVVVGVFFLSL